MKSYIHGSRRTTLQQFYEVCNLFLKMSQHDIWFHAFYRLHSTLVLVCGSMSDWSECVLINVAICGLKLVPDECNSTALFKVAVIRIGSTSITPILLCVRNLAQMLVDKEGWMLGVGHVV
jgi:hypothetical protein